MYAVTRDSQYASAKEVEGLTYEFAEFCDVQDRIEVIFRFQQGKSTQTNLPFLVIDIN
ncbi:MAG: hypothetical protein SVY53_11175 [Chloroflexota bacterium]|nr:hypothetical protein [Chloroflexota bacterium]